LRAIGGELRLKSIQDFLGQALDWPASSPSVAAPPLRMAAFATRALAMPSEIVHHLAPPVEWPTEWRSSD